VTGAGEVERGIAAPELGEVARTWWDVDHDPFVVWDASATRFELVDPAEPGSRLELVTLRTAPPDPAGAAASLAEAFAACDFPPTGRGVPAASAARVARALGLEPDHGAGSDPGVRR
jgi:hypothetical protein